MDGLLCLHRGHLEYVYANQHARVPSFDLPADPAVDLVLSQVR